MATRCAIPAPLLMRKAWTCTPVALSSDKSLPTAWKNQLIACSDNAGTTTVAERAKYHLLGTDRASLNGAFREIGERLVKLRRTL